MRSPFITICLLCALSCTASAQQNLPKWVSHIHEFDFWLGEWEVYTYDTDTLVGYSHIMSEVDSVVVYENYRGANSRFQGKSLNKYNPATDLWEQFWVDNSGLSLSLAGKAEPGKMVLSNAPGDAGSQQYNRITWLALPDGSVRQTWESSQDSSTWLVIFDGHFRPNPD